MIHVLHVEDNLSDLELLRMQIMRVSDDINITPAQSVEDALERLERDSFDCIICDIQLPNKNGLEMLQAVRSVGVSIPFIFLTGQGNEKIAAEALRMGASDYYSKESDLFSIKQLVNSIKKHVEGHYLKRSHEALLSQSKEMRLKFDSLLKNLDQPAFVVTSDLAIADYNSAFEDYILDDHKNNSSPEKTLALKNCSLAGAQDFISAANQSFLTGRPRKGSVSNIESDTNLANCDFTILPVYSNNSCTSAIVLLNPETRKRSENDKKLELQLENERRTLEKVSAQFRGQLTDRIRFEKIFSVLHNLSKTLATIKDTRLFYEQVCESLSALINTNNVFIALHEHDTVFSFPYIKDSHDDESLERDDLKGSLTDYIFRHGIAEIIDEKRHQELRDSGEVVNIVGNDSKCWMGVPLRTDGQVFGVLVVQSYSDPKAYDQDELNLITVISNQLSLVIKKKIAEEQLLRYQLRLEERVRERTRDLQNMNLQLQKEIELRTKSERVLSSMYKLSRSVLTTESLQELFVSIHKEIRALFSESELFVFHAPRPDNNCKLLFHSVEGEPTSTAEKFLPIASKEGQPFYYTPSQKMNLSTAHLDSLENERFSWMGAPLATKHGTCGAILIKKCDPEEIFTKSEFAIFTNISLNLAQAIEKKIIDDERQFLLEYQQEKNDQLHDLNQELEAFAYSVSHDLRKPIRHIHGFSEVLSDLAHERNDKELVGITDKICSACNNIGNLVNDLLTLSRINRIEINREKVNVSRLVRSILAELEENHPDHVVTKEIEKGIKLFAEPALTKVLLQNLLENAWKFTKYTENPTISITGVVKNGRNCVAISDNGAGFDGTKAKEIFAPFVRLHKESEYEGTGIGLATVARIIHRHEGSISVTAEPGKGATFTFYL